MKNAIISVVAALTGLGIAESIILIQNKKSKASSSEGDEAEPAVEFVVVEEEEKKDEPKAPSFTVVDK